MKERFMAEISPDTGGLAPPPGEGQSLVQPPADELNEPNVVISPQVGGPKEKSIELVKPTDSGISPSVEAYRKMEQEIASQERPIEVRSQLGGVEQEKKPEFEPLPPPMELGDEIARLNGLSFEERAKPENEQRLDKLYGYIEEYADGTVAEGLGYLGSGELTNIETQLVTIEHQLHQFRDQYPNLQPAFEVFDDLTNQMRTLKLKGALYETRLELDKEGQLVEQLRLSEESKQKAQEEADDAKRQFEIIENRQKELANQIASQTGINTADRRQLLDLRAELTWKRETERYKATKGSIETGWHYVTVPREELEEDLEPTVEELAVLNEKDDSGQLKWTVSALERIGDPVEHDRLLRLLFVKASKKGITRDIRTDINQKFEKYRKVLTNEGMREMLRQEKARYGSTIEDDSDWREVQLREELSADDVAQFRGIRGLYAERATDQMIAKRNRMVEGNEIPLTDHRMDGEWNINNEERRLQLVEKRTSSYEYRMGLEVILDDSTEDRFIASARQFTKDSYYGSPKFDPQEFLRRKSLLLQALIKQGDKFFSNEQIRRISMDMEVEFDYPIMNFATDNAMAQLYQGMAENHFYIGGDERIENLATLYDGRLIKAVIELEERENELILSPVGHRGQLIENIDGQGLLKSLRVESMVRGLTNLQVRGASYPERQAYLLRMQSEMSDEEITTLFEDIDWEGDYKKAEENVREAQNNLNEATSYDDKKAALARLNRAKWELYRFKDAWAEAREEAESALTLAIQFFNVTGESAKKSAPRFIMENGPEREVELEGRKRIEKFGDQIPVDWVVFFIKYALLYAIDESGDILKKLDQRATDGLGVVPEGEKAVGYITLGFNRIELQRVQEAVAILRRDGFKAKWKNKSLEDIIKDPRVDHMENNNIATYNSMRGRTIINSLKRWIEGGNSWLKHVLDVIDPKKELKETNQQQDLNEVRDKIELSRSLHYLVWKYAHKEWAKNDASHISWIPYTNLLLQRNLYPQAWWLVDQRHNISRGGDLVPSIPLWLPSIREYVGVRSMKEFIQTRRKGKGAYDSWILNTWFNMLKGIIPGRSAAEGVIDEKGERNWGIFQKPTRSIDRLRAMIKTFEVRGVDGKKVLAQAEAEELVLKSLESGIFGSWQAVAVWSAYILEEARGARGANTAWKEIRRFWKDYFAWLKDPTAGVPRRYLGGSEAYKSSAAYIKFIDEAYWEYDTAKKEGETVANGILGKLDPTHNAGIIRDV
ncbi:MAG: hypothetical protein Q8P92_04635 [Candidatus Daviesbacteria bacterium]|nr:hypothetical protein [Candidatus Daviesbacteria bacterium]